MSYSSQTQNTDREKLKTLKIMLVGEAAVGKSSIMYRYTMNSFSLNMLGTAGIDFKKKEITVDKTKYKIVLYDTAGHERFRKIIKNLCQGAHGVVLVYDIGEEKSIERLYNWMNDIKENADKNVEILLVGNKKDITPRKISEEQGIELSTKYNLPTIETSAKTGENITDAFDLLINNILKKEKDKEKDKDKGDNVESKNSTDNKVNELKVNRASPHKKDESIGCKCVIF